MKSTKLLSVLGSLSMLALLGCGSNNTVSSTAADADPAAKLTVSAAPVAGECNTPNCRPSFEKEISEPADQNVPDDNGSTPAQVAVMVTDDATTSEDLSGSADTDAAGDEALAIGWALNGVVSVEAIADVHVYASVDGAPAAYVGRTGDGSASLYEWRAGNGNIVTNAFADGPQTGSTYRFSIYIILNERDADGRFLKNGPFEATGDVTYSVSE